MSNLLKIKNDFRIVRLSELDAEFKTDHIDNLENLVLANEEMYPKIDKWFKKKVIPGIKTSERVGYVGYVYEKPMISAVVKRGKNSKFCHLRINKDFQDNNLGEIFFSVMALEVRKIANEIHFTLPESLWGKKLFQLLGLY